MEWTMDRDRNGHDGQNEQEWTAEWTMDDRRWTGMADPLERPTYHTTNLHAIPFVKAATSIKKLRAFRAFRGQKIGCSRDAMPASRRRSISPPTQLRKADLGTQEFWTEIMSPSGLTQHRRSDRSRFPAPTHHAPRTPHPAPRTPHPAPCTLYPNYR